MRLTRSSCLAFVAMLVTVVSTGCATEVIELDAPVTTNAATQSDVVIAADATLDELKVILRDEVAALSAATFDANRNLARIHLDRVNRAWQLMEPLIVAQFGELADQLTYDLQRVIELARSAVERNRPADADKAKLFLRLALASLEI